MRSAILGIGTATPAGSIAQGDAADLVCRGLPRLEQARAVRALFRLAGVQHRGSVLANPQGAQSFYADPPAPAPTTAERMDAYRDHARMLAVDASRRAMDRAGVGPSSITHLVTASCTGFCAPGPDREVIRAIGLDPGVRRTSIGFMGCHAAINALAVADALARSHPGARVLVCCVELCTLHLSRSEDPDRFVANALFADGAGAAVVAYSKTGGVHIEHHASRIFPDTDGLMTWTIGDHGFEMTLSPRVPAVLASSVPPWIDAVLQGSGRTREDIDSWAIHPGGPRVLDRLGEALRLDADRLDASRGVLREHGNMSSATVLFVLERLLERGFTGPVLAMAFGPGLAGEAMLLTKK